MPVGHDQHHPSIMARLTRNQAGTTKARSVRACSAIKPAATVFSWCLPTQLLAADRDFVVLVAGPEPASRAKLPLQGASFPTANFPSYKPGWLRFFLPLYTTQ